MNLRMSETLRRAYVSELEKYREAVRSGRRHDAWTFLERAHVVGQYHPLPHAEIHARMLLFALRNGDGREALGQLPRLTIGWLGSLMNRVPVGNTGGANVPILASMPIPEDLADVLSDADTGQRRLAGLKR